jgi:hypothetical protein
MYLCRYRQSRRRLASGACEKSLVLDVAGHSAAYCWYDLATVGVIPEA